MHGSGLYFMSLQDMFPGQKRTPPSAKTSESSIESASSTKNIGTGKRETEIAFASKDMPANEVAKNGIYCKMLPWKKSTQLWQQHRKAGKQIAVKNKLVDE